jgi:hypothetical protein
VPVDELLNALADRPLLQLPSEGDLAGIGQRVLSQPLARLGVEHLVHPVGHPASHVLLLKEPCLDQLGSLVHQP